MYAEGICFTESRSDASSSLREDWVWPERDANFVRVWETFHICSWGVAHFLKKEVGGKGRKQKTNFVDWELDNP